MRQLPRYFFVLVCCFVFSNVFSQANLHYRTRGGNNGTGNWNTATIWETSAIGTGSFTTATVPPDQTSASILIRNNNTVTVSTSGVTARSLTISTNNGILNIIDGGTITVVDDGTGAADLSVASGGTVVVAGNLIIGQNASYSHAGVLTVTGILSNYGSISGTTAANAAFQSGGRYRHLVAANGTIPLATWNANSTMEVAGYTGSVTASPTGNWGQNFGHVEINCAGLADGAVVNFAGRLTTITGNLIVTSTGGGASTGRVVFINGSPATINVGGNLVTAPDTRSSIVGNGGSSTMNVNGNVVNDGLLILANGNGSSSLTVNGSLTNSGTFTISTGNGSPTLTVNSTLTNDGAFTKTTGNGSPSLIVRSDITNNGSFTPGNGGTVFFDGFSIVTGSPNFYHLQLNAGRTLIIPSGDVGVAGHLTFDASGFLNQTGGILFNGTIDQDINNNGLEFRLLRINKASGVVNMNHALPLGHLLDIQSSTEVNTNDNLIIRSQGNTTDLDASIGPIADGASINGKVTVQRFVDPIGVTYRYMASPVYDTLPPAEWGTSIYEYMYLNGTGGWVKRGASANLALGTGYAVRVPNGVDEVTWSVTGPVHAGDFVWDFAEEGWHLLGNPYASAIRWYDSSYAWELDNIATTIAVTSNSISGYPNYFRFWSFDPEDNPDTWGLGPLENGVVAMGQAFWVYVGTGGGSLTLKERGKAIEGDGEFYRKRNSLRSEQLVISIHNGKLSDRAFLKINPHATEDYDFRYDLMKLWNEEMNIYLLDKGQRPLLASSHKDLSSGTDIPLGVQVSGPGEYRISFSNLDHFRSAPSMYLVDSYNNIAHPLTGGDYAFTINNVSKPLTDRFYISFNNEISKRKLEDLVQAFPNPVQEKLTVQLPENMKAKISLLDGKGGLLMADQIEGEYLIDMKDFPKGMYVLRVFTSEGVVVRKIIR